MSLTLHYDFTQAPVATGVLEALNSKGPDLTVTRASTATFTDWESNLRTVQNNEPRITGARRVENLCLQSQDFSTSWTNNNSTDLGGQDDPFGGTDAFYVQDNGVDDDHRIELSNFVSTVANGEFTFSVYAKANTLNYLALYGNPWGKGKYFDLASGTITGNLIAAPNNSGIESLGNGWYRCWISHTSATDGTGDDLRVYLSEDGVSYQYAGSSNSVYIYGAQLENVSGQADPSPSEYVATTTAAAYSWFDTYKPAPSSVTNLWLQSETFDNASWTKQFITITTGQADPDGGTAADALVEDATTNVHRPSQAYSWVAGTKYTFSVYLKAGLRDYCKIEFGTAAFGTNVNASFNLSDGTVFSEGSSVLSTGVLDAGDGWYRCYCVANCTTTTSTSIWLSISTDGSTTSYAGSDGSTAVTAYGAQLETAYHGANSVPSTYIPTTTQAESSYRTNLCLQSQTFENASWTNLYTTDQADQASAPDGTMTADALFETAVTNYHRNKITVDCENSTTHVFSVYVKANGRSKVGLRESHITARYSTFDLDAETVIENGTDSVGGIQSVGDGWYRVWVIQDSGATSFGPSIYILDSTYSSGSPSSHTYAGDVTKGLYIWGAQLEKSAAPVPSTYIATTTAAQSANFATNSVDGTALDTAPTGLLVEEARTNLILRSEEFDDAAWDKGSCTVDADAAVAPDGATSMDRLNVTAADAKHELVNNAAITTTSDTDYAVSAFVKDDGAGFFGIYFGSGAGTNKISAVWDLSNGVLGETDVGATSGTVTSTSIEDYGNGTYRVCIVGQWTGTVSYVLSFTSDSATPTYDGGRATYLGVAGEDVFCWGAQVEAGSFPTSYIGPTEGSSVTRNADVVKTTDMTWWNDSLGSIYADFSQLYDTSNAACVMEISKDSNNIHRLRRGTGAANTVSYQCVDGSVQKAFITPTGFNDLSAKMAVGYEENSFAAYADGNAGTPDTSGTLPTAIDNLVIGANYLGTSLFLNGHIAEIRYYDTRLTNAQLENLSNGVFPVFGNKTGPALGFGMIGKLGAIN